MRSERGHTVLIATVLGIVAFSAWALAFLTTRDLVRTEKLIELRNERDQSVTRALARGIYLMRTGFPPSEPYECIVGVGEAADAESPLYECTVRFEREPGDDERWTVTATRSTEEELGILPEAPERFEPRAVASEAESESESAESGSESEASEAESESASESETEPGGG